MTVNERCSGPRGRAGQVHRLLYIERLVMIEAYTAGFLDADGTLCLGKSNGKQEEYSRTPIVELCNCDKGILEYIQTNWGGNIRSRKPSNKNTNVSYQLKLSGDAALVLLNDIFPYMKHDKKKRRAKLIIDNYKRLTPRNGFYTEKMKMEKIALINEVMSITMRGAGAY